MLWIVSRQALGTMFKYLNEARDKGLAQKILS